MVSTEQEHVAHRFRAGRMRQMGTMLKTMRRMPEIWRDMYPVIEQGHKAEQQNAGGKELHTIFRSLLRAVYLNPVGAYFMDRKIDTVVREESAYIAEQIENGANYTPKIVIGTGISGAAFAVENIHYDPATPVVMLEQEKRIGGVFGRLSRAAWQLNNRNRPENADLPTLPGTEGSITGIGYHAPLNISDLTLETYGSQHRWGQAARTDSLLSAHILADHTTDGIIRNANPDQSGKYGITKQDGEAQSTLYTDAVFITTGIGEEQLIPGADAETTAVIEQERGTKVFGLFDFMEQVTDERNMFPMEQFADKEIAVIGGKDSGKIVLKQLFGYMDQQSKSVTQTGFVKGPVFWLNQRAKTKEEYVASTRTVYAELANEFPREGNPDYFYRIEPADGKAVALRQVGDRIRLVYENNGQTEYIDRDIVICTTGFENSVEGLLQQLTSTQQITDKAQIQADLLTLIQKQGTKFIYNDSAQKNGALGELITSLEVSHVEQKGKKVSVALTKRFSNGRELTVTIDNIQAFLPSLQNLLGNTDYIEAVETPYIPELEPFYDPEGKTQAPIAMRVKGEDIYVAGPAAKLKVEDSERDSSPALKIVAENSASVFRYRDKITALARYAAKFSRNTENVPVQQDLLRALSERQTQPVVIENEDDTGPLSIEIEPVDTDPNRQGISSNIRFSDIAAFTVESHLGGFQFPQGIENLEMQICRTDTGSFSVDIAEGTLDKEILQKMMTEELWQRLMSNATHKNVSPLQTMELHIPIRNGKVVPEEVEMRIPRRKKKSLNA